MNVAILGFGTVGFGVYELAVKCKEINVKYVLDIKIHNDIEATSVTDINVILNDDSVDTVIELIGGRNPAYSFIKSSLEHGKNVITANKLVICENYKELTDLASKNGVALRYTAAVGGGIPWLTNLERFVRISHIRKIEGIFNGTTNYILDAMHKNGTKFETALKKAQELGYAEADPSSDIDGLDTERKIAISANIAYGIDINTDSIDLFGIGDIKPEAVKDAESLGAVIRLIATAHKTEDGISVYVEPTFVKNGTGFSGISENFNRIVYEADNLGYGSFHGYGAGRYPTAFTVINDVLDVANGIKKTYNCIAEPTEINNNSEMHEYYVLTNDTDRFDGMIKEKLDSGFIVNSVSVAEMHRIAKEIKTDGKEIFICGLRR